MRQKRGTLRNPVIAHASLHAGPLAPEDDDDRLYLQIELMNDRAITLSEVDPGFGTGRLVGAEPFPS